MAKVVTLQEEKFTIGNFTAIVTFNIPDKSLTIKDLDKQDFRVEELSQIEFGNWFALITEIKTEADILFA